jgi:hypothetical protein
MSEDITDLASPVEDISDLASPVSGAAGGQQPAHVQNLMSRLGPLLMSGAKAAVGPRFVQAGKDIAAGAAARSERTERAPTLPEQALSGLGEAAGLAVGVPWELGKAAIGTTADALKSITPQPVQQAIQPAAQATESGLQKVVRGIGNIPLPGGNKVSDIPAGAVETWKQLPQRAKDITSSVGDISMVAPVGKGTQLLAKGAEKLEKGIVAPFAERMAKKDIVQKQVKVDEQIAKAVKKGISKGIKPTVVGKKTLARHDKFYLDANDAVKTIADNRDNVKIVDENGESAPHPRSSAEMAQAVDQTKKILYKQYHDMALAAGDKGAQLDVAPIIAKIDKVSKDLKENPETRAYAESLKAEIQELQGQSPEIIEARIKDLNSSLAGFYEGRTAKAKARIDGSVANLMREELDNKITGAVGEGYQGLKNKYGSLKAIEKEVNHRAIVNARKAGKSIIDMTDIFTGGDLAAGVLTMNPLLIAKGVAGRGLKELYKAINNPDRAVAAMFKKVYGLSDRAKVVSGMRKGAKIPEPPPEPPAALPAPQGTMQTQFIPGQEPGAPVPKPGIPQTIKNLGNEGGYIDLGGASAPVEPPPTAPKGAPGAAAKTPHEQLIERIRGQKPSEAPITPEIQQAQIAQLRTERDAKATEIEAQKNAKSELFPDEPITPDEIASKKNDNNIDFFKKIGYTYDEGRKVYAYNPDPADVERVWSAFGRDRRDVSQRSEELRAEIEAKRAAEQLPRGAEVPPVEGAPSQSGEVAQGESKPPQDVLPQGSETEPQGSLSPEDQATQDRLTRIAERKERKPGEVYTHDLTDNPQANRVLWRDNVRRQVKWHIDHDENGTLRDDRKDQWAYVMGESTKTGEPVNITPRTQGILQGHSFEFSAGDYGPSEMELRSEEMTPDEGKQYWTEDLGQPEGEMPVTWDEVMQEIRSAETSRGQAERVTKGHVVNAGKVEDGGEEAKYAAEQDERKSEEASHEEQAAIEGERGSMQNVIDMLKGESGAIATGGKVADPLYSNAAKAVSDITMPKAPASQWLSMLDPAKGKGTKADEMKWIGLDDYLKEKGDQTVTKQEIQDFIEQNKVKLEEVTKGQNLGKINLKSKYATPRVVKLAKEWQGDVDDALWLTLANDGDAYRELTKKFPELAKDENWASTVADDVYGGGGNVVETKFGSYQLPGGENYREVLLRLPSQKVKNEYVPILENGKWTLKNNKNGEVFLGGFENEQKAIAAAKDRNARSTPQETGYRSPHWDEPNVLAHMRLNDRVDADGKKVLFIEEIQSDWHQAGRKKGYKFPKNDMLDLPEGYVTRQRNLGGVTLFKGDEAVGTFNSREAAIDGLNQQRTPAAPFSKTWHELAFKRILREAAEKGYDRVEWTPGEPQAERYDLSKQIDNIGYRLDGDGTYEIAAIKDGETVITKHGQTPNDLEGIVGKDVTTKIVNGEGTPRKGGGNVRDLSGVDLKVGGEGMKGFYDKILVDYANKYGKKWGTSVKDAYLNETASNPDLPIATEYAQGKKPVHSMTITPAMRASVMGEGQPMFAVTGGAGIAGTLAAMQASRDKNKKGVSDVVSRMKSKRK